MHDPSQAPLKRIDLRLAREPGHPDGDAQIGYTFLAPLTDEQTIDATACHFHGDQCRVVKHAPGLYGQFGSLVRREDRQWAFRFEKGDEIIFRLERERLAPGEYLSVQEADGEHTFFIDRVSMV